MGKAPIPGEHRIFAGIDGLRIQIRNYPDERRQNLYYNKWLRKENVLLVIVFDMMGRIIWATANHPGKTNDFVAAREALQLILDPLRTAPGYIVVADDAFSSAATDPKIATAKRYYRAWRGSRRVRARTRARATLCARARARAQPCVRSLKRTRVRTHAR
jgi:hypothetical protein